MSDVAFSPLPNKKQQVVKSQMTFGEAMNAVVSGKEVTRLEWSNPEEYGFLQADFLHIHRNGEDHIWQVSDGDIVANDWIVF